MIGVEFFQLLRAAAAALVAFALVQFLAQLLR